MNKELRHLHVLILLMTVLFTLMSGCSSNNKNENETWNYKEGYILAKENNKVLVVRDKFNDKKQRSEILKEAQPNAIWLSVTATDYDAVHISDQIKIAIPNGLINQSYPAQAQAQIVKK